MELYGNTRKLWQQGQTFWDGNSLRDPESFTEVKPERLQHYIKQSFFVPWECDRSVLLISEASSLIATEILRGLRGTRPQSICPQQMAAGH